MTFYHIILTAKALAWVGIACFGVGIFGGSWWFAVGALCMLPMVSVVLSLLVWLWFRTTRRWSQYSDDNQQH